MLSKRSHALDTITIMLFMPITRASDTMATVISNPATFQTDRRLRIDYIRTAIESHAHHQVGILTRVRESSQTMRLKNRVRPFSLHISILVLRLNTTPTASHRIA